MPIAVGSTAPDFTLKTMTPEGLADVRLSDHRGKDTVVLLFFPGAFTSVCTTELCDVTSGLGSYQALNAVVYGISVDSAFAQSGWAKANQIEVPLLSDYRREVVAAYDVVLPDLAGLGPSATRAVFVIDKEGVIRYAEQTENPGVQPNFDALLEAVRAVA
ncbi:MAG TPA: redoxin domain-containing protein [Fimbriimonadaceae bacterium]|nr:redoxin domain-containing protein [Fimbriimonadaceae bacterium]